MNTATFEVKDESEIPENELHTDLWLRLTHDQEVVLRSMNRKQRREWFSMEMKRILK